MSDKPKLLSDQEAKAARERGESFLEMCGVLGIELPPDVRAYIAQLEEQKLGYDEFRVRLNEWLMQKWKTEEDK